MVSVAVCMQVTFWRNCIRREESTGLKAHIWLHREHLQAVLGSRPVWLQETGQLFTISGSSSCHLRWWRTVLGEL